MTTRARIRVLALSPIPEEGAGCRVRVSQYVPYLASQGIDVTVSPFFTPEFFKFVSDFDKRFPDGAPSLKEATSFTVEGDWTFGHGVSIAGEVSLDRPKTAQRVAPGTALGADA